MPLPLPTTIALYLPQARPYFLIIHTGVNDKGETIFSYPPTIEEYAIEKLPAIEPVPGLLGTYILHVGGKTVRKQIKDYDSEMIVRNTSTHEVVKAVYISQPMHMIGEVFYSLPRLKVPLVLIPALASAVAPAPSVSPIPVFNAPAIYDASWNIIAPYNNIINGSGSASAPSVTDVSGNSIAHVSNQIISNALNANKKKKKSTDPSVAPSKPKGDLSPFVAKQLMALAQFKHDFCPIVAEEFSAGNTAVMPCGHLFAQIAIEESFKKEPYKCPSCRQTGRPTYV